LICATANIFTSPWFLRGFNEWIGRSQSREQLRQISVELHMIPIREALYFSAVQDLFDENGNVKDETYHKRVQAFLMTCFYAEKIKNNQ
jgi:hypothetical protein